MAIGFFVRDKSKLGAMFFIHYASPSKTKSLHVDKLAYLRHAVKLYDDSALARYCVPDKKNNWLRPDRARDFDSLVPVAEQADQAGQDCGQRTIKRYSACTPWES